MNAPATLGVVALERADFEALRRLIYGLTGIKLGDEKQSLVSNRLQRRLRELSFDTFRKYVAHLESGLAGEETSHLINAITTNKTSFFREPHHFDFVMNTMVPELLERARAGGPRRLRIWSSACSMGHEPWSIAIALQQSLGLHHDWDVRILASDVDTAVLATAEAATYAADQIADVPAAFRADAFVKVGDDAYQVAPALRQLVTFRQINLVQRPWPIQAKFDAVFCRNVAIYFDRATQKPLFEALAATLQPTGYLFSGHSENLHWLNDLLEPVGNTVHRLRGAAPQSAVRLVAAPDTNATKDTRKLGAVKAVVVKAKEVSIQSGDVHATREHTVIRTLLGSCVAVCLYDPERHIGGMNHFMLPDGDGAERSPAYFGIHAMEMLINQLMKLGADRRRLVAKVFGASELRTRSTIASGNAAFALAFLRDENIPVLAQKVGGVLPLSVLFDTATGTVRVREVEASTEVVAAETKARPKPVVSSSNDLQGVYFFGGGR